MSKLIIEIDLDNEAFDTRPGREVGRILTKYAQSISVLSDLDKNLKDINGNTVGRATVESSSECEHPHARPFSLTDQTLWCFQCGDVLAEVTQ